MTCAHPAAPADPPRQRLILGNWKMHGSRASNAAWLEQLCTGLSTLPSLLQTASIDMGICVPYPYLYQIQTALADTPVRWGAQDISAQPAGAHTGDVCASMLADFGVSWVLVGHSERRNQHGETAQLVAKKAHAALAQGITPVVCLGETLAQQQAGLTEHILTEQLAPVLDLGTSALTHLVFAYEPVWAIGTGKTALPDDVQRVHALIRSEIATQDATIASSLPILYGGSVKPANAAALLALPDVDGGLIGGAALVASDFLAIIAAAAG